MPQHAVQNSTEASLSAGPWLVHADGAASLRLRGRRGTHAGVTTPETPAGPGGDAGRAPLSEGQYEFTGDENMRIERAGTSSAIWAVCAMVGAVLLGTLAVVQVYCTTFVVRSWWFRFF